MWDEQATGDPAWVTGTWIVVSVTLVAWLVTLGIYSLVMIGLSTDRTCYPNMGTVEVENTWAPPGYVCRRQARSYGGPGIYLREGPGPKSGALQLFLLAVPPLSWWAAGLGIEAVTRRRRVSEVLTFAGIGLGAVGGMAVVVGSTGLGAIFLTIAVILWAWGFAYRRRHREASDQVAAEGPLSTDSA